MEKPMYKNCFVEGPVPPEMISKSIAAHQSKTGIGAHQIFLGQVRADIIDGKQVKAIHYTAYEELALKQFHLIREETFARYELSCMHIHHSLGTVKCGELCLFVFISAPRRKNVFEAISYLVERIKKEVPVFGQEILEDDTHQWKVNT